MGALNYANAEHLSRRDRRSSVCTCRPSSCGFPARARILEGRLQSSGRVNVMHHVRRRATEPQDLIKAGHEAKRRPRQSLNVPRFFSFRRFGKCAPICCWWNHVLPAQYAEKNGKTIRRGAYDAWKAGRSFTLDLSGKFRRCGKNIIEARGGAHQDECDWQRAIFLTVQNWR